MLNACIHRRLRCTKPESSKDVIKRDPLKLKKKNSDVSNESKQNANASVWKTDDDLDLNALLNDDISLTAVAAGNKASQKTEDTFEDASEVMLTEDFGEKRKESDLKSQLEMRLIGAPQVLIREPETQLYPIYTEGECDERVTVANSMLTSDMCAFKAQIRERSLLISCVGIHLAISLTGNYQNACPSQETRGKLCSKTQSLSPLKIKNCYSIQLPKVSACYIC